MQATSDPLGNRTTYGYDAANQQTSVQDAKGNVATSAYDAAGRLAGTQNALGAWTTFSYDGAGQRTQVQNARGYLTTFQYDAAGNQTAQIDPLNRRTTYQYDPTGQRSVRTDARNRFTTYTYDAAGRVTGRQYTTMARHTFTYDLVGNRTLMFDGAGRTTYSYDAVNRVSAVGSPPGKTITYSYDAAGRRSGLQDPDGGLFTYSYYADDRAKTVKNPQSELTTYSYDSAGQETQKELANGAKATTIYDAAGRVTRLANLKSDNSVLSSFDYAYDPAGNRTSVLESSGARVTWTYDATNQLLSERRSVNNTYYITHTYDAAGNRTAQNSSVNGTRTTYAYDAADQLTSSDASTSSSRTVTTFTYDTSGNLLTEKENGTVKVTSTWDDENRRAKVQLVSGGPGDYAYNADGQRVLKTIAGAQTRLVWDGEAYLMELDSTNATNAVYTVAPSPFGMLIAQRRKSGAVWTPSHYLFDALGSTDRLLSAAEAVTDSYVYRAFGELAASTGSTTNPFRWVGELGYYYDPVGTQSDYYVRARWYKPAIARWLSMDPLGFAAGDFNLFRYVRNGILIAIDPTGLRGPVTIPNPGPTRPGPTRPGPTRPGPTRPGPGYPGRTPRRSPGQPPIGGDWPDFPDFPEPRRIPPHTPLPPGYPGGPGPHVEPEPGTPEWERYARRCWERQRRKAQQECDDVRDAYKDAQKRGGGYGIETDCDILKAMCSALDDEIAGRQKWLDLGCAYQGKGSFHDAQERERGHKQATDDTRRAAEKCWKKHHLCK